MAIKSPFRAKHILPLLFALVLTSFSKRAGFFECLCSFHPFLVGIVPLSISSEKQWGFTFHELYGGDPISNATSKKHGERLRGQTAIVTGANSGIGYQITLALARLGVSVTMACRNPTRCEAAAKKILEDDVVVQRRDRDQELASPPVATMTVDTSSLQSVKKFCDDFLAKTDDGKGNPLPLDMLFLNAGISFASLTEDGSLNLSEDGIEMTFATNVVGHHLMYKLLEPSIRRSDELRKTPARIVQTSSCMSYAYFHQYRVATDLATLNGVRAQDWSLYPQSKLAQILWVKALTDQLDNEAENGNPNKVIYANAGNPGAVATNIWHTHEGETMSIIALSTKFLARLHQSIFWTPEEGALTLLYLGTAVEKLQEENIRGQYFHPQSTPMDDHKLFRYDNAEQTKILQEKLWKFLDELVADFL